MTFFVSVMNRPKGTCQQTDLSELPTDGSTQAVDYEKASSSRESSASNHNESSALLPEAKRLSLSEGLNHEEEQRPVKESSIR